MLDGFVGFPPDFAARYREKGYWLDRSLRDQFAENVFAPFADRIAISDGDVSVTYAELDATAERLALNLWELGLRASLSAEAYQHELGRGGLALWPHPAWSAARTGTVLEGGLNAKRGQKELWQTVNQRHW